MRNNYRPDIDALRGVSILATMVFHLDHMYLPGGPNAIESFFVISGFVVASSLFRLEKVSVADVIHFFKRRILRLLPALIFVAAVSICLALAFVPFSEVRRMLSSGAAALLGMSNLYFIILSADYFAQPQAYNIFTHTWSLGVEEQFYLTMPFIALLMLRIRRKFGSYWGMVPMLIAASLSLALSCYLTGRYVEWAYFFMPARFWSLASGVMLAWLLCQRKQVVPDISRNGRLFLQIFGSALLLSSFFIETRPEVFPFPLALLPVIGSLCIIYAGHFPATRFNSPTTGTFLVAVGTRSYSLYLWHWPIFVLFKWNLDFSQPKFQIIAFVIALVAGWLTYAYLEKPIRQKTYLPNRTVFATALLSSTGAVAIILLISAIEGSSYNPVEAEICKINNPCIYNGTAGMSSVDTMHKCLQPRGEFPHRLFLIGDSHAGHWRFMLQDFAASQSYEFRNYTVGAGCGFIPPDLVTKASETATKCSKYISNVNQFLDETAQAGDVIVVSAEAAKFMPTFYKFRKSNFRRQEEISQENGATIQHYADFLADLARRLSAKHANLLLLGDVPALPADIHVCLNAKDPALCKSNAPMVRRYLEGLRNSYRSLASQHSNIFFWDPVDLMCNAEDCLGVRDNVALYYDSTHIGPHSVSLFIDDFTSWSREHKVFIEPETLKAH